MKAYWTAVAAAFFVVVSSTVPAAGPPKADGLNALEKKLLGAWIGQGGCDGEMVFQADGTYHVRDWQLEATWGTGTWKIEWNELPPTLVLSPTSYEIEFLELDDLKPTKVALTTLTKKALHFRYPDRSGHYLRGTEADDVRIRIAILGKAVREYAAVHRKLPANLKTLVDAKIISSKSLVDPWGKEFHYDIPGKKNRSRDIWTETPDKKVIGNWLE